MSLLGNGSGSKRSGRVQLSTMVSAVAAAAGSAILAGCGSDPAPVDPEPNAPKTEVQAFGNVFECKANSDLSQDQCADARKQAVAAGEEIGPRFAGQGDCEKEWGGGTCVEQRVGGSHFFAPFVTGFLVGKMLKGGKRDYLPLYRRAGESGYSTANGVRLSYGGAPGKYLAVARALERPKTIPAIKASTGAVARGGLAANDEDDGGAFRIRRSSSSRARGG